MSRFAAVVADLWFLSVGATLLLAGADYAARTVFHHSLHVDSASPAWAVVSAGTAFLYVFLATEVAGRTPGKAVVGLRVVRWDGDPVRAWAAFVRTLAIAPSVLLLGLGLLVGLLQRDRRALHDLVAGTAVVHDWSPRPVELPPGLSRALLRPPLP